MPAPGRGTGVLQVGAVTDTGDGTATVTVAGGSYTLPSIDPWPTGEVWVLFAGRTGVILGQVQT